MKFNLDTKKMFEGKMMQFVKAQDQVNFSSKLVEGTKITVVIPEEEYQKINIKIIGKPLSAFASLQPGMTISFKDFEGIPYIFNNRIEGSYTASDVVLVKENNKATLPNLN